MDIGSRSARRRTVRRIAFVPWVFAIAVGLAAPMDAPTALAAPAPIACAVNEYKNVDDVCVPRPEPPPGGGIPQGATARCRDGDYSFSLHRRGTCSGHGGVDQWLADLS